MKNLRTPFDYPWSLHEAQQGAEFLYLGTCRGTSELKCCCVWSQKSTYPKLTENTIADVVVVGAGLTGRFHSNQFLD